MHRKYPGLEKYKVVVVTSHPVQYYSPWFRQLSRSIGIVVLFCHRQTPKGQAAAGFGIEFEWDTDLLGGFQYRFLENVSGSPSTDRFSGCDTPEIGRVIEEENPDVVIVMGWYLKSYLQALYAAWIRKIPTIVKGDSQLGMDGSILKNIIKRIVYPSLFKRIDAFLVVGTRFEEYLKNYGVPKERMFIVPHCIDNEWFGKMARSEACVSGALIRWPVRKETALRVLFAGKLIGKKRPLDLVMAAAVLSRRGCKLDLAFAGDGALRGDIEEAAASVNVAARILGFCNQGEMPGLYASADILVLPSNRNETWGLVVNEAMACGTPAVVSDAVGCAVDLIETGRTGEVYRCGDVEGLANAIEKLARVARTITVIRSLENKISEYSVEKATAGTLNAVGYLMHE